MPGEDETSEGSGDEYAQERRAPVKARSRKKKTRRTDEDDEHSQAKKRKRGKQIKQYDEAELDDMTPEDGQCYNTRPTPWWVQKILLIRES